MFNIVNAAQWVIICLACSVLVKRANEKQSIPTATGQALVATLLQTANMGAKGEGHTKEKSLRFLAIP